MNGYESIYIFSPATSEETQKGLEQKLSTIVTARGGKVEHLDSWGRRRLAYPVKKQEYGIYQLFYFSLPEGDLKELDTLFRHSEDILLWQTVRVNDIEAEIKQFQELKDNGSLAQKISER
ncbi:MAG: 30S ribosomal protein S6 [Deltaproteobacteria bacterium]|nr:30S ribosomal protein S6 [Deltaproteobacteria bacterium]